MSFDTSTRRPSETSYPRILLICAFIGNDTRMAFGARERGNALLFGAVLCEASYVVIGKMFTDNVAPRHISALVNL